MNPLLKTGKIIPIQEIKKRSNENKLEKLILEVVAQIPDGGSLEIDQEFVKPGTFSTKAHKMRLEKKIPDYVRPVRAKGKIYLAKLNTPTAQETKPQVTISKRKIATN